MTSQKSGNSMFLFIALFFVCLEFLDMWAVENNAVVGYVTSSITLTFWGFAAILSHQEH